MPDISTESPQAPRLQARFDFLADCEAAINELFRDARESKGADAAFMEFLASARQFSNLSVFNSMLVNIQRPGAVAVASRRKWASIERRIKPGTPPLLILWPFGPVAYVYEYADTEGREIDGEKANQMFAQGQPPAHSLEKLIAGARRFDVEVEFDRRQGPLSAGFAHASISDRGAIKSKKPRPAWRVVINQALDEPSRFATLAHELGHVFCGHLGAGHNGAWPDRRALVGTAECELEAEAVSYIVCQRNGLTTRSHQYLADHIGNADLDRISMFAIYEAANRVESRTARRAASDGVIEPEEIWFPLLTGSDSNDG